MIPLVKDTIDNKDVDTLIEWLKTYPRLTKGEKTIEFEEQFSKWLGVKYSVFVNSGSTANFLMLYTLKQLGVCRNNLIVVPALSWATTVAPVYQLGADPIFCDASPNTLGVDICCLEKIFKKYQPSVLFLVHVLGFTCAMDEIIALCKKYGVILLEDSCETMGSIYNGKMAGTFGLMSSFSTYFGHTISTIEGGFVCTDDDEIYKLLKMYRSHGWARDISEKEREYYRNKNSISDFKEPFTFYEMGFNFRSTDLQAYIGLEQLKKLNSITVKRHNNFMLYQDLIKNPVWKVKPDNKNTTISNFAYPIIANYNSFEELLLALKENGIETRPLIAGSITKQPFVKEIKYPTECYFAENMVNRRGIYLPNNYYITEDEIKFICGIVNIVLDKPLNENGIL